ncbi:MAG: carbohydrate ABC transporter permease [Rhizobiaceae bacterium]|nr:carbohydrate ABC transporter permease [Rhizobiaceae bacterium]
MKLTPSEKLLCYVVAIVFSIVLIAPIAWLLSSAFKDQLGIFQSPPVLFTDNPTLDNFREVLADKQFTDAFWNSVIIGVSTVILTMVFATPAAYGLSRMRSGFKVGLLSWVLLVRAAPGMIYIVPYFVAFNQIGLMDTKTGLVLINSVFTIPLAIWIMIAFFDAVPKEVEEAAHVDGATRVQTLLRVALPMAAPGVASTAILVFIFAWNEFLFALTMTRIDARTAAIAILDYMAFEGTAWGKVAAAGILILLPVLIFSIFIRKYLVQSAAGAVKE